MPGDAPPREVRLSLLVRLERADGARSSADVCARSPVCELCDHAVRGVVGCLLIGAYESRDCLAGLGVVTLDLLDAKYSCERGCPFDLVAVRLDAVRLAPEACE